MSLHSQNSICNYEVSFVQEGLNAAKSKNTLNVYDKEIFQNYEELFNEDLKRAGKLCYNYTVHQPNYANLYNISSMLERVIINAGYEIDEELKNYVDEAAIYLSKAKIDLCKLAFGMYCFAKNIETYGKIIGGSYTKVKSELKNHILDLEYLFHFDILVPAPIYTKEFSKNKDQKLPTDKDIISLTGMAQSTVKSMDGFHLRFKLTKPYSLDYSFPRIALDNVSDTCVLLPDYNFNMFFEQVKKRKYQGSDIIRKIKLGEKEEEFKQLELEFDDTKETESINVHQFFKDKIITNKKSKNPNKKFKIIGIYLDSKPTSSNYGKLSFAVKELNGSSHATSWWLPKDGINPNIKFEDPIADKYYRTNECKRDLINIKSLLKKEETTTVNKAYTSAKKVIDYVNNECNLSEHDKKVLLDFFNNK